MAVYVESLRPFQPWELEAGVKLALESHKFSKWPLPAEMRDYCMSARLDSQRQSRPAIEPPKYQQKPERREVTPEERALVNMKFAVWREWEANGKYMAKDENGKWLYSAADCTTEAKRRLAAERQEGKAA